MSAQQDDAADRSHEPTQRRLDEARRKGDIARSPDLIAGVALAGFALAAIAAGPWLFRAMGAQGALLLGEAPRRAADMAQGARAAVMQDLAPLIAPAAVLLLAPAAAALAALVATRGIVFAGDRLVPKWSRIDPIANAGQKFGLDGLMGFARSTVKLVLVATLLALFLVSRAEEVLGSAAQGARGAAVAMVVLIRDFLLIGVALALVIGGVDALWQAFRHRQRQRMTRQELLDELKESEGDPQVRQQRRDRGREIAMNRMLSDVPKADVVIVNPTHYAVALKWDRARGTAPVCLAKGVDEIAARIRARAAEHGVPIHRDPPTARALHAVLEPGDPIRPEHYRAVAAAIRFAEAMRARARRRKGGAA
jgi:flagellar biosynthetic protein FlhB